MNIHEENEEHDIFETLLVPDILTFNDIHHEPKEVLVYQFYASKLCELALEKIDFNKQRVKLEIFWTNKLIAELWRLRNYITDIEILDMFSRYTGSELELSEIFISICELPLLERIDILFISSDKLESELYLMVLCRLLQSSKLKYLRFVLTSNERQMLQNNLKLNRNFFKLLYETKIQAVCCSETGLLNCNSLATNNGNVLLLEKVLTTINKNVNIVHFVWDLPYFFADIAIDSTSEKLKNLFKILAELLFKKKSFRYGCSKKIDVLAQMIEQIQQNKLFEAYPDYPLQSFHYESNFALDINHIKILDKIIRNSQNLIDFSIYTPFRNIYFQQDFLNQFTKMILKHEFDFFLFGRMISVDYWIHFACDILENMQITQSLKLFFSSQYFENEEFNQILNAFFKRVNKYWLVKDAIHKFSPYPDVINELLIDYSKHSPTQIVIDSCCYSTVFDGLFADKPFEYKMQNAEKLNEYIKECNISFQLFDRKIF